jgi:hypothetical protein
MVILVFQVARLLGVLVVQVFGTDVTMIVMFALLTFITIRFGRFLEFFHVNAEV